MTPADRIEAVARIIDPAAFEAEAWQVMEPLALAEYFAEQKAARLAKALARAQSVLAYLEAQEPTP